MNFSLPHTCQESGTNNRFGGPYSSFQEYIADSQMMIRQARLDLGGENADWIVQANSPAEFIPEEKPSKGILLIHGLFDSPFVLQSVFDYYRDKGFLVRSILLPGHGTVPGDLLSVRLDEWKKAVAFGIDSFKGQVDTLWVAGHSTGASLALYHAYQGAPIDKLILFAPAIKIKSAIDFTGNWHRLISWAWPRTKWFALREETDYAKYLSIPFNAAHQVFLLTKELAKLAEPTLAASPGETSTTTAARRLSSGEPAAKATASNTKVPAGKRAFTLLGVLRSARSKAKRFVTRSGPAKPVAQIPGSRSPGSAVSGS